MARPKKEQEEPTEVTNEGVKTEVTKQVKKGYVLFDNEEGQEVTFASLHTAKRLLINNNHRYTANGNSDFWDKQLTDDEAATMERNKRNFERVDAMNKVNELNNNR